jgi:glycosyltransferase involved in cell wall biosynthesis
MRILMITPQLPTRTRPGTMAPTARQIASVRAAGAEVDVLEITGVQKLKYLQALPRLWSLARAVDLIHAHYGYCGWLARSHLRKPVVVSFMGDDLLGTPDATGRVSGLSKFVVRGDCWIARTVDAVIVKSPEMAQIVAPIKAHIIPNGVDLHTFRPMDAHAARALLGWTEGKRYILFAGCPDAPRKGFPLARATVMRAVTHMAEPMELVPLWEVAPERVPLYMNACDALLMTSFVEGSPNVVKEAMACNLPVVSVPVGDVPELLTGVKGGVICPRQAEALGAALVRLLRDGQRSAGRLALRRQGLDQESVARKIMTVYAEVLTQRRG